MPNKPHHQGDYPRQARLIRAAAYANPNTQCWRCGKTLPQHGPKARWTAGHTTDSQIGGELRPEASTCNYSAGARHGNKQRRTHPSPLDW